MSAVKIDDPARMNVLGLLMQGFLTAVLADPAQLARAQKMSGDVWLRAGLMWCTLRFDGEGIQVFRGKTDGRKASVEGEMDTLLGVVTGAGVVGPFLAGKIKIGGNPFFLLKMLPILTAGS